MAVLDTGTRAVPGPAGALLVVEQDWDACSARAWDQAAASAGVLFSAWRDGSLAREPGAQQLT